MAGRARRAAGTRGVGEQRFRLLHKDFSGPARPRRLGAALTPIGSFSVLTVDGDNDTWSVTLFTSTKDAPLKALRDPERFAQVVRACPMQANWLDGEPITPVLPIAGVMDCYRRLARSRPVQARILAAAGQDADVLRGVLETAHCLALPEEVFQRPGIRERIEASDPVPPPRAPGPDRAQLLELLRS